MLAEPDVAFTDYGLALESGAFAVLLDRVHPLCRRFALFFGATAVASLLGGTVHGFFPDASSAGSSVLWPATLLAIGVAAFAAWNVAACLALSPTYARWVTRVAALELIAYAALVIAGAQTFAIAVRNYLPAAAVLFVVLVAAFVRRRDGATLLGAIGLGLTFVAAGLQHARVALHPHYFDHNALYHLLQGIALAMLYACARGLDRGTEC